MILPTKHVSLDHSLLGAGAVMLRILAEPATPSKLWDRVKGSPQVGGYGRYVLTLDMLS